MKKTLVLLLLAMVSMIARAEEKQWSRPQGPIQEVPFTAVHLSDAFWLPRIEINRTVSIPSAFKECEKNGRFDNFAIAAGLMKGEHRGDYPFDDTDPYKVIEGASYSLAVHYDAALDHYLDSVINIIAQAQEEDGYLTTCVTNRCERLSAWWGTKRWEKDNSHELYNSGHLIESAVAHYRATGKRSFLNVAIKNADLVCQVFGPNSGQIHRPGGHPIIEMALCKLYKATGNRRYLEQAKYFIDETGRLTNGRKPSAYSQDHKPILEQEAITGHAVRAGYLYSGVADMVMLTGDVAYRQALCRIWDNMADKKLFITGGIGSRSMGEGFGDDYELNNYTAYCETCASIANVYWNYRMFLATGEAKYVDVYERALYNGVMSGVSLSGDRFFYDNPLESMGEHERAPWFGCACCPGNVTRFVASLPYYIYATQQNDIFVNLYVQGTADIKTANNVVKLTQTTQMPWEGKVDISVSPKKQRAFAIRLRVPSWAMDRPLDNNLYAFTDKGRGVSVMVNGKAVEAPVAVTTDGYLTIYRKWKRGDKITLSLPMDVRRVVANDNVVDDHGKMALQRGPVVYCLEGNDQPDRKVVGKYVLASTPISATYEPLLLGGVVTLAGDAKLLNADGEVSDVGFKAIPYSTWNNRGKSQMAVWIPTSPRYVRLPSAPSVGSPATAGGQTVKEPLASQATSYQLSGENEYRAWGVNDLWEPTSSTDISRPYHCWWMFEGGDANILYRWKEPVEVSNVQVYWLYLDHYDGNFRMPERWRLSYLDDKGEWKDVENLSPYGVSLNRYNSVDFKPVTTRALKITATLKKDVSAGVLEWKVN